MFFGTGLTSSVIQAAGAPGGGTSARPNALVVLVKTKRPTPAATDSSSRFSVPVRLVSTKSCRVWEPTCGLCSVAACRTASTPCSASRTSARSATEPTSVVCADGRTSIDTTSSTGVAQHATQRLPEVTG